MRVTCAHPSRRGISGFSLPELLVVMAIVGILASVLGAFFGSQTRVSTRVQEGNELSIRLQRVAEALTQD
jgi:prepilin-type N-terminal cleavage/methylation domain